MLIAPVMIAHNQFDAPRNLGYERSDFNMTRVFRASEYGTETLRPLTVFQNAMPPHK